MAPLGNTVPALVWSFVLNDLFGIFIFLMHMYKPRVSNMSNKFLDAESSVTGDLTADSITLNNLTAFLPVKSNASKKLISTLLDVSDIDGLAGDLQLKTNLDFIEGTTPSNPVNNQLRLFAKTDKKLWIVNSIGVELELQTSGSSSNTTWTFSDATSGAPIEGQFRYDFTTPTSVTELVVNQVNSNGSNQRPIILTLKENDQLYFCNHPSETNCKLFTITGPVVDQSTYFEIPVTLENQNNVANFIDSDDISVLFLPQTSDLQTSYNLSTIPQIETSTALGALTIQRGSAADTDEVFVVADGAGNKDFVVTGEGDMKCNIITSEGEPVLLKVAENTNTGLISGGLVTANGANPLDQIDISAGSGVISYNGTVTSVSWNAIIGTSVLAGTSNVVYIDNTGSVLIIAANSTTETRRQHIRLAGIGLVTNLIVSIQNLPANLDNVLQNLNDFAQAIGIFNTDGNIITPNGANLSIDKNIGKLFQLFSNYQTNEYDPNTNTTPALIAPGLLRLTQTGATGITSAFLDVANYDVGGVVTALPGGSNVFCTHRISITADNLLIMSYGQVTYGSLSAAIDNIPTEPHISVLGSGILLRCYITFKKNTVNLSLTVDNSFITASRFGASQIGGSSSTTDMQVSYNNSVAPQIITDAVRGAIEFKQGSGADTDTVFEILDGAGASTASINGFGDILSKNIRTEDREVHIGFDAGANSPGTNSVCIGAGAGFQSCGANSINIGNGAAQTSAPANSINLNATGLTTAPLTSGFFVDPLRTLAQSGNTAPLYYNNSTRELTTDNFANSCVALGTDTLQGGTCSFSTAIGNQAGSISTNTLDCVFMGSNAGGSNTGTRIACLYLGANSGSTTTQTNGNIIAIGANVINNNDNTCVIGDSAITIIKNSLDGGCDLGSVTERFNAIHSKGGFHFDNGEASKTVSITSPNGNPGIVYSGAALGNYNRIDVESVANATASNRHLKWSHNSSGSGMKLYDDRFELFNSDLVMNGGLITGAFYRETLIWGGNASNNTEYYRVNERASGSTTASIGILTDNVCTVAGVVDRGILSSGMNNNANLLIYKNGSLEETVLSIGGTSAYESFNLASPITVAIGDQISCRTVTLWGNVILKLSIRVPLE